MGNNTEIERKFLVKSDDFKNHATIQTHIMQGYLNTDKERTVRVRIRNEQGFLTIKGKTAADGVTRFEWEKEIPKKDAEELLSICEEGVIEKIRFEIPHGNHVFEVDQFFKDNEGLVIAEIELSSAEETFTKPDWLGEEVSGQLKYYNSHLIKHPFKTWT